MKILFNGDSITDACRMSDPDFQRGYGYPMYLSAMITNQYIKEDIEIINRGISGDVVSGLNSRWKEDCIDLKPDVVSILVGINDVGFNEDNETFGTQKEFDRFEKEYNEILAKTKEAGIENIVLLEPFVLPFDVDRSHWRKDLDPKIQITRKLAQKYKTFFVSLDGFFNELAIQNGYRNYTRDGVHPSPLGHYLIASRWLEVMSPKLDELFLRK